MRVIDHNHASEDESYFVSMTDLMVGMLFIFIIMLMAFALNLRAQEEKFDETTTALTKANKTRSQMLEYIKQTMLERGIKVKIDTENGILRLPEELLFDRGEFELKGQGQEALETLADVLASILPCYAMTASAPIESCPPNPGGRLEAIFIEGHTDDLPVRGRMPNGIENNWQLSTARAIATFDALVGRSPLLDKIQSYKGQALLGVSGYADKRPADVAKTEDARDKNRRIDLRFLMAIPTSEELNKIKDDLGRKMTAQ